MHAKTPPLLPGSCKSTQHGSLPSLPQQQALPLEPLIVAGAATTPSTLCRVTNFIEDIDKVHRDPTTTAQRHQAQRTAADAQQRRAEDARTLLRQRAAAAADLGAVEVAWLAFKKADREGCGKLKASEFAQVGCRQAYSEWAGLPGLGGVAGWATQEEEEEGLQ